MKIGPLSPKLSKKIKVANFFLKHRLRSLAPFGLFVLYVADLTDIINQHDVTLHSFADDTQLYLHCCREGSHSSQGVHHGCWSLDVC